MDPESSVACALADAPGVLAWNGLSDPGGCLLDEARPQLHDGHCVTPPRAARDEELDADYG